MTQWFEEWAVDWISLLVPGTQVLLIALAAWLLQRLLARGLTSLAGRYHMPPSMLLPLRGAIRWRVSQCTLDRPHRFLSGGRAGIFCHLERAVEYLLCSLNFYRWSVSAR